MIKKLSILLFTFALGGLSLAQDTFSIIAADPSTGEIGSAGASCVVGVGNQGLIDIIAKIIPGRGGINSQAYVCIPNVNLNNASIQMANGASPSEIIDYLMDNDACGSRNFDPRYRQYGIVDFDGAGNVRTAGFTGSLADGYKEDRQGINYSIQGNILINKSVIDSMEAKFLRTNGTLADKLMAALQGANFAGADVRCLGNGTSSTTAYLVVYQPDDPEDNPSIRLNVGEQPSRVEPIDLLQDLYNDLTVSVNNSELQEQIKLFPNPAHSFLTLTHSDAIRVASIKVFDLKGALVHSQDIAQPEATHHKLEVSTFVDGLYLMDILTDRGAVRMKFVKE
ncbi:MAG: DUF1028 domain-containing protein [Bacteroidota bacterium]